MSVKRRILLNTMATLRKKKYGTRPKIIVELEKDISEAIEINKQKPKHHPGIIKNKIVEFPEKITKAIGKILQDQPIKPLCEEGADLARYLKARHLPLEEDEMKSKIAEAELFVHKKSGVNVTLLTDEEKESFKVKHKGIIQKVVNQRVYSWKPVNYDNYNSKLYLVARTDAEYAVLHRVFTEMKLRIADFKPRTLLDFGSGVGAVTWVANKFWAESLSEYFCVDSSADMNDLASLILRDGQEQNEIPFKGVFYRQFLPASQTLKYDIVVSAYSLFELPNLHSRLQTVLNLWNKTQNYLVIVEQGTKAGFQAVNEAREFILDFSNRSDTTSVMPAAHVFAPCPHDDLCPRLLQNVSLCNFEVSYQSLFGRRQVVKRESFSYVVIKKGSRSSDDPQWPRIVRETLCRSKHTICRLCTSSGKLQEVIFTASSHGKPTYSCAKASRWGDLLPVQIHEHKGSLQDEQPQARPMDEEIH